MTFSYGAVIITVNLGHWSFSKHVYLNYRTASVFSADCIWEKNKTTKENTGIKCNLNYGHVKAFLLK